MKDFRCVLNFHDFEYERFIDGSFGESVVTRCVRCDKVSVNFHRYDDKDLLYQWTLRQLKEDK